jgi:hypothetical protein
MLNDLKEIWYNIIIIIIMVSLNLFNGISSLSFSLIPYLFNTPTFVQTRLNILSLVSSSYNIISEYRAL